VTDLADRALHFAPDGAPLFLRLVEVRNHEDSAHGGPGEFVAIAGVWQPDIVSGLSGKVKLGLAESFTKVDGTLASTTFIIQNRHTFAHAWLALGLAWRLGDHVDLTADYDWTRAAYWDPAAKQTRDAGAFSFGAAYLF
jgi:hypothetical protein